MKVLEKLKITGPRICNYPTGMITERWDLVAYKGRLRLSVERIIKEGRCPIKISWGKYELTGSFIPKNARGIICHESLPVVGFDTLEKAFTRAQLWADKLN